MLRHIGEIEAAKKIENALIVTMEEGQVRTGDVVGYDSGKAGKTTEYTDAIISNLGKASSKYKVRDYKPLKMPEVSPEPVKAKSRRVVGIDLFIESSDHPTKIGPAVAALVEGSPLMLKMISNRGTQIYPDKGTIIDCIDASTCRLMLRKADGDLSDAEIFALLPKLAAKMKWTHLEKLNEFDGAPGFTKAQGED